jgi:hypothetical protein
MRRALITAMFVALGVVSLPAQVRFHGIPPSVTSITPAGSGHHGGFGGFGHHGAFGGRIFVHGGFGFGHHPRFKVFFGNGFFPHRRFFHRGFFPIVAPFPVYAGPIYPYAPPYAYPPPYPIAYQNGPVADDRGYDDLSRQVDRLREEVDRLREERYDRDRTEAQPSRSQEKPTAETPATILVFRDGRRLETRNYAIAGQTLWIFSEQRATKRPLSDLDLDATREVNEARGVEFRVGGR